MASCSLASKVAGFACRTADLSPSPAGTISRCRAASQRYLRSASLNPSRTTILAIRTRPRCREHSYVSCESYEGLPRNHKRKGRKSKALGTCRALRVRPQGGGLAVTHPPSGDLQSRLRIGSGPKASAAREIDKEQTLVGTVCASCRNPPRCLSIDKRKHLTRALAEFKRPHLIIPTPSSFNSSPFFESLARTSFPVSYDRRQRPSRNLEVPPPTFPLRQPCEASACRFSQAQRGRLSRALVPECSCCSSFLG